MEQAQTYDAGLLRQQVLDHLKAYLAQRDFFYVPAWNQFRRLTPTGFQSVIVSWSPYPDQSVLEIHVGVRHDAVENLAFPFTNGLPGFQPNSMTLVTPLARLYDEPHQRFGVATEADVKEVLPLIISRLQTRGVSFLEKYTRLEALDALFNARPGEPVQLVHNQLHRCLRAIAVARLVLRRDFESLGAFYRRQLGFLAAPAAILERYERLLLYLRSYYPN